MALINLKSNLSLIKRQDKSPKKEGTDIPKGFGDDLGLDDFDPNRMPPTPPKTAPDIPKGFGDDLGLDDFSPNDLNNPPNTSPQNQTSLMDMVSKYAPVGGQANTNQIGGRHNPIDPPEHSLLNLDGTPFLGGIPNSANAFGAGPLYSNPPDAPTTLDTNNPYPISTGLVDSFSGRKGEWGDGTLPLGFTPNQTNSLLMLNIAEPIITPLSWQVAGVGSSHPFGSNDGFEFNITDVTSYVSDLSLGTQATPQLYPIDIGSVNPLIPNNSTLHDITNPTSYSDINFSFNNTPAINDSNEYEPTPYTGTSITPSGNYGSQLTPPNPPSTHPAVNSQFGISYGQYTFNSISILATRYKDIHTAGNDTNLYPYADTFAGVEDTESSLFTITNPVTYLESLTSTFNDDSWDGGNYDGLDTITPTSPPSYGFGTNPPNPPSTVDIVNTKFGIAYGPYTFDKISDLAVRYKDIHLPGNNTNLYPYSNQQTGINDLLTGLHSITNPNNELWYLQDQYINDWSNPNYGGENTSGEPPFSGWVSKMKSRFDDSGTGRYQIAIPTDSARYTFPAIDYGADTDYKFSTQFGYTYTDAYDKIYEKKVLFRIPNDVESSPLGNYIKDGAWSDKADMINNYGYHSRLVIPKDYQGDPSTNYSFNSITDMALRYNGLHTAYSNLNLYPYSNASQSLSLSETGLHTMNVVNVTPSHTYPAIPTAEDGGNMTIGPFNIPTTNYTGDGHYTWPTADIVTSLGDGVDAKFQSFYVAEDSLLNNYGFNSLNSIPALTQETSMGKPHDVVYKFDKISDLAIRYKGETGAIPGRKKIYNIGGDKSSFKKGDVKAQYGTMTGYRFTRAKMEEASGERQQGWFSGPAMYTGDGTSGPMKLTGGSFYKSMMDVNLAGASNITQLVGATFADVMNKGRWMLSPNGIIWLAGQFILQNLNQRPETRLFNPLSMAFSLVPTQHRRRHFVFGSGASTYGETDEVDTEKYESKNRQVMLYKDKILTAKTSAATVLSGAIGKFFGGIATTLRGGNVVGPNVVNSKDIPTDSLVKGSSISTDYKLKTYDQIQAIAADGKSKALNYEKFMAQKDVKMFGWDSYKMGKQGGQGLERIGYDDDGNYIIRFTEELAGTQDELNKTNVLSSTGEDFSATDLVQYDDNDFVRLRMHWKSKLDPLTGQQDGTIKTRMLVFRCIIDGLSDSYSTDYGSTRYVGRPDKVHVYQGMERKISFNLTMHPMSRQELKPMYDKLNALVGLTSPDFDRQDKSEDLIGERMVAPIVKMTLGNYLTDTPCIVESCNLTFDDKGTWEIDKGMQLPRYVKAAISLIYVGDSVPRMGHKYFNHTGFDDTEMKKTTTAGKFNKSKK